MSDPMSNREIEDVLSSIRRLVARESSRPAPDRLVLTEAQRIAVNDTSAPASVIPAAGADSDAGAGDDIADEGERAAVAGPGAPGVEIGAEAQTEDAAGWVAGPETAEPFAPRETPTADTGCGEGPDEATYGAAQGDGGDYGEAEEWHGPARFGQGHGDTGETETGEEEAGDLEAGSDEAGALADTLIDEDMLRALVAQLVREELRGQLGERITLLVRKLVRAEIARALDEREYL